MQANAVIWVDGPSDRVYIRHWIDIVAGSEAFIEGIDYSIMSYGGGLNSHLSGNDLSDDEVDEFIYLRRLNRYSLIVIDSDLKSSTAVLGKTKARLQEEFNRVEPNTCWITSGYTIENYIPKDVLSEAVTLSHPRSGGLAWQGDQFTNPLAGMESANKVKIAREVCERWGTLDETPLADLATHVAAIVKFIAEANRNTNPARAKTSAIGRV